MPSELDLFIRDFAVPLFRELGFTKSGLIFRRKVGSGDWMIVQFLRYPLGVMGSFHVAVGYVAAPVKAVNEIQWVGAPQPHKPPSMMWMGRAVMRSILPPDGVTWEYDHAIERAACGQQMQVRVTTAIAAMNVLADRDVLFDVEFAPIKAAIPHTRPFPDGGWGMLGLLAERGPSSRLDQMLSDSPDMPAPIRTWLDTRVNEPRAARSLDEYDEPVRAFREGLKHRVDPVMAGLGFLGSDTGYVRVSERGGDAVVDVTPSMTTSVRTCVFYVKAGVRTHASIASPPHALSPVRLMGDTAEVAPGPGRALTEPDVAALGLRPWRVKLDPIDLSAFDELAVAVARAVQLVGPG